MIRASLDSNILVYATLEPDSGKGRLAFDLVAASAQQGVLAAQALGEYLWVIRRRRPELVANALVTVRKLQATFTIVDTTTELLLAAAEFQARFQLQFWDAVIWRAATNAGATLLLSEDFQDGFAVDGMRVLDPFKPANAAVLDTLLAPGPFR